MNKKTLIIGAIIIIAALAGSFYGGMSYGKSSGPAAGKQNFMNNGQMPRGGGFQNKNGNLTAGEIILKDDKSITVKLRDGGSKIIFYSSSSEIGKFTDGTIDDLKIGKNVIVNGKTNSDGSITAQSIQIRPKMELPLPPAQPTDNIK